MSVFRLAVIAVVVWWWSTAPAAVAHPLDPSLLEITESSNATLDVLWRPSSTQSGEVPLQPILPAGCTNLTTPIVSQGGPRATVRWRMGCAGRGLVGQRVGVQGLRERQTDALLRVHLADGRSVKAVLRGDAPAMTIPEGTGALDVLRGYLGLGFEHILTGPDHLLFVLGLVLLVRGRLLAVGMRQMMRTGRGAVWGPRLFGLAYIIGGMLRADAVAGFPPGTTPEMTHISPDGVRRRIDVPGHRRRRAGLPARPAPGSP